MTATQTKPTDPAPPSEPTAPDTEVSSSMGLWILAGLLGTVLVLAGWSLFLVIISLVVMIFMHELGHYMAAKRAGMKVTEFFIGFGPRIWSFHRGETEYGIKAIWLGAYVRVIGMNNLDDDVALGEEHRTYRAAKYRDRLLLAVAGSAMHFLMAILFLYAGFAVFGVEQDFDGPWTINAVSEESSADEMGLAAGDNIVSFDGVEAVSFDDFAEVVRARGDQTIDVVVERNGEELVLTGRVGTNPETGLGLLGVSPTYPRITEGPIGAAGSAVSEFGTGIKAAVTGLGNFFSPDGLENFFRQVAGQEETNAAGDVVVDDSGRIMSVVGVARVGADITEDSWAGFVLLMAGINIFVGVFNLVPLLPLDGGHVAVATYERIRSRRGERYHADVAKLLPLTYMVLLVLGVVGLSAIYLDIADPISLQ